MATLVVFSIGFAIVASKIDACFGTFVRVITGAVIKGLLLVQ
jgi:hypothetical protein